MAKIRRVPVIAGYDRSIMKKSDTLKLTLSAVIVAILTLMAFVPQIGFIVIIPAMGVSLNFLLIPVCIAAIILGFYYGFGASRLYFSGVAHTVYLQCYI